MKVRTRFAPSPTGYLHIGGLRTALYAWLFARKHGGDFILRIEDTDRGRLVDDACDIIYRTMRDVGLEYDEGPDVGGDLARIYRANERIFICNTRNSLWKRARHIIAFVPPSGWRSSGRKLAAWPNMTSAALPYRWRKPGGGWLPGRAM